MKRQRKVFHRTELSNTVKNVIWITQNKTEKFGLIWIKASLNHD